MASASRGKVYSFAPESPLTAAASTHRAEVLSLATSGAQPSTRRQTGAPGLGQGPPLLWGASGPGLGEGEGWGPGRDSGGRGRFLAPGIPRQPRPRLFRDRPTAAGLRAARRGRLRPPAARTLGAAAHPWASGATAQARVRAAEGGGRGEPSQGRIPAASHRLPESEANPRLAASLTFWWRPATVSRAARRDRRPGAGRGGGAGQMTSPGAAAEGRAGRGRGV